MKKKQFSKLNIKFNDGITLELLMEKGFVFNCFINDGNLQEKLRSKFEYLKPGVNMIIFNDIMVLQKMICKLQNRLI